MRAAAPLLLLLSAALAAGEACGFALGGLASAWPAAAVLTALAILFGYGFSLRGWWFVATLLVGMTAAMQSASARQRALSSASRGNVPFERVFTVEGDPEVRPPDDAGLCRSTFPSSFAGVRVKVVCDTPPAAVPAYGEKWRCAGWLRRAPVGDRRQRTLYVNGRGTFAERVAPASVLATALAALRHDLSRRLGIGLDCAPEIADLNRAILLGERAHLPAKTKRIFRDAGTMHVFAISGLHVMLIADLLIFASALFFVPRRFAGVFALPMLWAYVAMVGGSPSAVRAAAMASVYLTAPVAWRRPDALAAWSVTFLAVHLADPQNLLDIGCRLSFVVMLGIVLWGRWVRRRGRTRLDWLWFAVAAWAAGTPVAAQAFGRFTPGGILANLVLIPAASVSVTCAAVGAAASYVSETLAAHVNNLAALFTQAMVGISHAVASLPYASVEVAPWSGWLCAAWYAVIALSFWLWSSISNRRRERL